MNHSQSYISLLLLFLSFSLCACSQGDNTERLNATVNHHKYSLGSSTVELRETKYKSDIPVQLVLLHSNEETADQVATSISSELGINYLKILNDNSRIIQFDIGNKPYRFDPNRIFSRVGIASTLRLRSQYSETAIVTISKFSQVLLSLLDTSKTIITVHNNTDNSFTALDYTKKNSGLVYQNPAHDPDDFFITTDSTIFQKLKEQNFNVVLEYSQDIEDDGSLSVYCGRNKIRYVNVEAQHDHIKEQELMLRTLLRLLEE